VQPPNNPFAALKDLMRGSGSDTSPASPAPDPQNSGVE
jgi:hypothetical protein